MESEIFDCCLQTKLNPLIYKNRNLPTQTQMRKNLGNDLTDVIFSQMDPIEKILMGIDKPLKGPPKQMWINPHDKIKNDIKLTPITHEEDIRALTHQGILKIGESLEKKFMLHEKYKIETAVKEAIEFEQFEGKLKMEYLLKCEGEKYEREMKLLELKLLEEQKRREGYLKSLFENELESLIKCLEGKDHQTMRETDKEAVEKARAHLNELYENRYMSALSKRIQSLKDELESNNLPRSIEWKSENSSEYESSYDTKSSTLEMELTPQNLMKGIIEHIHNNQKFLKEVEINGLEWEKKVIKKAIEENISYFLNGDKLRLYINEAIECSKIERELTKNDKEGFVGAKLVTTKDSLDIINLPHIPEIPPVITSKIIQTQDSLEILSLRLGSASKEKKGNSDSSERNEKQALFDFKPKTSKHFDVVDRSFFRNKCKIPYKECTDEDIEEMFAEYEVNHIENPCNSNVTNSKTSIET